MGNQLDSVIRFMGEKAFEEGVRCSFEPGYRQAKRERQRTEIMASRETPKPTEDAAYETCSWVIESRAERQAWTKFLPDTTDLPSTHEHFVRHFTEERNGCEVMLIEVGVRRKQAAHLPLHPPTTEADGLNAMDDATLETEAARVGVKDYPKSASRA